MNKAQRWMTFGGLIGLALGFHLWNLRWSYEAWQPYYGGWNGPSGRFATITWKTEPEIPGFFSSWRAGLGEEGQRHSSMFRDWREWGDEMWRRYERDGRPMEWVNYLRTHSEATNYFGLWRTGAEDDAWIWGVFAPVGFLAVGVFLFLGWREPRRVVENRDTPPT